MTRWRNPASVLSKTDFAAWSKKIEMQGFADKAQQFNARVDDVESIWRDRWSGVMMGDEHSQGLAPGKMTSRAALAPRRSLAGRVGGSGFALRHARPWRSIKRLRPFFAVVRKFLLFVYQTTSSSYG